MATSISFFSMVVGAYNQHEYGCKCRYFLSLKVDSSRRFLPAPSSRFILFPTHLINKIIDHPVPISAKLLAILVRAKGEAISSYVCDSPSDVHFMVKAIGRELKIDGLSPHVFRHTWATRAVERGVVIAKVAAFLGDNEETVRKNYVHLSQDYLRDALET